MKTAYLLNRFNQIFNGDPWYGASISDILNQQYVNPNFCIGDGNSIGHIVEHMLAWRNFVIEKLNGNKEFDITPETDWQKERKYSKTDFFQLTEDFKASHNKLIDLIENKPNDEWLLDIVPKRSYNFEYLLDGIIQHDIYHLGQVSILKSGSENI